VGGGEGAEDAERMRVALGTLWVEDPAVSDLFSLLVVCNELPLPLTVELTVAPPNPAAEIERRGITFDLNDISSTSSESDSESVISMISG
jgi:hypothetical protein